MSEQKRNTEVDGFSEGLLFALIPVPLLCSGVREMSFASPEFWMRLIPSVLSSVCLLVCVLSITHPKRMKIFGFAALFFGLSAFIPGFTDSPALALAVLIVGITCGFFLYDMGPLPAHGRSTRRSMLFSARRVSGAASFVLILMFCELFFLKERAFLHRLVLCLSGMITMGIYWNNTRLVERVLWRRIRFFWCGIFLVLLPVSVWVPMTMTTVLLSLFPLLPVIPASAAMYAENRIGSLSFLLLHPARLLLTTFLLLCVFGTLLLSLPVSTRGGIPALDAAFTAVSAVCVTGLNVVDPATVFTPLGQGVLMLLIQLGGLGIMSITTIALYSIGRRLSVNHEQVMSSLTETCGRDLIASLKLVFTVTFLTEFCGGVILTALFVVQYSRPLPLALWEGFFTAVSGFCNAGFSLQSANMAAYRESSLILVTVSLLIIIGGLAPSACVLFPR